MSLLCHSLFSLTSGLSFLLIISKNLFFLPLIFYFFLFAITSFFFFFFLLFSFSFFHLVWFICSPPPPATPFFKGRSSDHWYETFNLSNINIQYYKCLKSCCSCLHMFYCHIFVSTQFKMSSNFFLILHLTLDLFIYILQFPNI